MTARILRTAVALYLVAWMAVGMPAWAQAQAQQQSQPPAQQSQSATAQPSATQPSYLNMFQGPNYSKGKRLFPNPFSAYSPMRIPLPELLNSPTLLSMIHDS